MKIAVVGAGISGLATGVILSQNHDVHLFESEARLGGHAHTTYIQEKEKDIAMDVGFLVFNELTYPQFTGFLKYLNVQSVDSEMSLSIKSTLQDLEWAGTNLNTVFGQRKNLLKPKFYKMLFEILRFHKEAESNLSLSRRHGWTLRDLFAARKFSRELSEQYILPIGAAIWSTPEFEMGEYPADTFLTFFINHKLLQVNDRPIWKTILGGSVNYVNKCEKLITHIHQSTQVTNVISRGDKVIVQTNKGEDIFDRVIMATHAPVTAKLLKEPTAREREIFNNFKVEPNSAVLHTDKFFMPKTKRCWSSWNVYSGVEKKVSLTYFLNRLQPLQTERNYFLTLNPQQLASDELRSFSFHHPLFNRDTIRAQRELDDIQGKRGIYYVGAWTRYGFHEDGILSAVRVAEKMGVMPPWQPVII